MIIFTILSGILALLLLLILIILALLFGGFVATLLGILIYAIGGLIMCIWVPDFYMPFLPDIVYLRISFVIGAIAMIIYLGHELWLR